MKSLRVLGRDVPDAQDGRAPGAGALGRGSCGSEKESVRAGGVLDLLRGSWQSAERKEPALCKDPRGRPHASGLIGLRSPPAKKPVPELRP